jgi:hypothetical protein
MNWKGFCKKRSWNNFKVLSWHSPGGTEKNHEILNQDSWLPGPSYELGTSRILSRSVNHSNTTFGGAGRGRLLASTWALWQVWHQRQISGNQVELGLRNYVFGLRSIFVHTSKGFLTCSRILKFSEGVLRIYIALKMHCPRPWLNPRTLSPIEIMLAIRSLRSNQFIFL